MADVWDMVKKYWEKFGVAYPLRWLSNLTDEEHIAKIEGCLNSGVPIKPTYEENRDY